MTFEHRAVVWFVVPSAGLLSGLATGDFSNVLKVKPPLCLTEASADFFADRLDEVLRLGW